MPRAPKDPPRIPGYDILEPIGSGGQGSVWRARQVSLDRVVAIKVLWAEDANDPVIARRFIAEARIASKLNHPNIIQVIDVGETDGTFWYAMEYVAGVTALGLFRERGPLPEGEVLEVAWQVAQALQHGADRGLVHGDLKPENILITPEGVAKVVDFGLARLSRKRGWHASREEAPVQGTEGFVAPEVLENKSMGDARSDLFALGVTLYELITTTLPPAPKRGAKLGPDVRERRPNATRRTAELIMRLLSPDPARRPESAASVLEELGRRSMITLPATVSPVAPVKPPQSARLHRAAGGAGRRRAIASIVIIGVIVGATFLLKSMLAKSSKPEARSTPASTALPPPESGDQPPSVPPPTPATSKPDPVPIPVAPVETQPARGERVWPPVQPAPEPDRPPAESRETAKAEPKREPEEPKRQPEEPPKPAPPEPVSRPSAEPGSEPIPAPPTPAPEPSRNNGGAANAPPSEPVAVTSTAAAIRVFPPAPGSLNAAWTVIVPGGEPCDLQVRTPRGFESKDTAVEVVNEGRAKGLSVKSAESHHVAAFRVDRAAPWGPRDFTVVFRRGGATWRVRLRFQVVRPNLLAIGPAPALKEALQWLERHAAADGAISASSFAARCKGNRTCDGPGKDGCTGGVTALAALAALRSGESGDWVRSALAYLVALQRTDGRFASADNPFGAYTHMIATEATALGWHLLGDADVGAAAQRGVQAIEAARNDKTGGGAWRYSIQGGDNDTSVTIWAMRALLTAKMAGLKVSEEAINGGNEWIRRVTETNPNDLGKGRIGYRAPGELSARAQDRALEYPAALSEALTAGALSVALLSGDRKPGDEMAKAGAALVLLCRPYWDASTPEAAAFIRKRLSNPNADLSVISSHDFCFWQHGTHMMRTWKALRGLSVPEDKKWNLAKILTPAQRKDGCVAGSFDPHDPWGPELGRSGSTAMLALALANEQYYQGVLDEFPQ